jgi:hypothetical protein
MGNDQVFVIKAILASLDDKVFPARVPRHTVQRESLLAIPGVGELPYTVFLMLLIGFAVVLGPLNFLFLHKLRRPNLLLLTVPAVSFVASLGLFLFGIFAQGLGAKGASQSLTLLDQRGGWASTIEERATYVPLAPAPGLRPEAGTMVFPIVVHESRRFVVEQSSGILLGAGFLPVRSQFDHVALTDRPAHLRLDFEASEGRYSVLNSLPVRIERLFLRDRAGHVHGTSSPLGPGDKIVLESMDNAVDQADATSPILHPLLTRRSFLPSSYVAEIEGAPFVDACGLEVELLHSKHVIYGILPENEEDW